MAIVVGSHKSHERGRTVIAYEERSDSVVTGGSEGLVRVYPGLVARDASGRDWARVSYNLLCPVGALACQRDRVFTACNTNRIEMYSVLVQGQGAVIGQSGGAVTHLGMSGNKEYLVSGWEDGVVRLHALGAATTTGANGAHGRFETVLGTHKGSGTTNNGPRPVMSVAVNHEGSMVASAGCDGCVNVWGSSNSRYSLLKSFPLITEYKDIPSNDNGNRCRLQWHPVHTFILAVPTDGDIKLIDCHNFSVRGKLKWSSVTGKAVTECAFNQDGSLLAAGTADGWICLWATPLGPASATPLVINRSSLRLIHSWRNPRLASITGLVWHGKQQSVLLSADFSGTWEAIKFDLEAIKKQSEAEGEEADPISTDTDPISTNKTKDNDDIEDFDVDFFDFDEEDEVDHPNNQSMVEKEGSALKNKANEHSNELSEESENENEISLSKLKAQYESPNKEADLEGGLFGSRPETQDLNKSIRPISVSNASKKRTVSMEGNVEEHHGPIQSTRCPRRGDLQLIVWNSIGSVKSRQSEILVEFRDASTHDWLNIRHASMGMRWVSVADVNRFGLLVVSCPSLRDGHRGNNRNFSHGDRLVDSEDEDDLDDDEDKEEQAIVYARPIQALWTEWRLTLPRREAVIDCCLLGNEYAVVMTRSCLRYFHLETEGRQSHIETLPGESVAIASWKCDGYRDNTSNPWPHAMVTVVETGRQLMWRLDRHSSGPWMVAGKLVGVVSSIWHPLPLSRSASLVWIGFSETGALYTVDSKQVARRLIIDLDREDRFSSPRWVPVLNFRLSIDKILRDVDRYFPVSFYDGGERNYVMAVRCNKSRYPEVHWDIRELPRYDILEYQLPLCQPKDEANIIEGSLILNQIMPDWTVDSDNWVIIEKQLLLKLFANAVTNSLDSRAMAIARMMPDLQVIKLAIKFAARSNKKILAQKLGQLALQREKELEEMNEENEENEEEDVDAVSDNDQENIPVAEKEKSPKRFEESDDRSDEVSSLLSDKKEDKNERSAEEVINPFKSKEQKKPARMTLAKIEQLSREMKEKEAKKKKSPVKSDRFFGSYTPESQAKQNLKRPRKSGKSDGTPLTKFLKK